MDDTLISKTTRSLSQQMAYMCHKQCVHLCAHATFFFGKFGVCWCTIICLINVYVLKELCFCRLVVVWLDLSEHNIMVCQLSIWWCHSSHSLQQRVAAKALAGPMLFFLVAWSCLMLHGLFCSRMLYGAQSSTLSLIL